MNGQVRIITLYAFRPLDFAHISCMSPFLAVFTLWHARVHVHTSNSSDEVSYVKSPIDEAFSLCTTLCIPYVNPDNGNV